MDFGKSSSFTSIIGPNGSGKSNMMDAISFVLGIRAKQLRSSQLKDLIYRGRIMTQDEEEQATQSSDPESAYIKAIYRRDDKSILELKRTISLSGSDYYINDRSVSFNEYSNILAQENILIKAKNFLVFQGDVEAVASQSPQDLCKLIEKISGSAEYAVEYERFKRQEHEVANASMAILQQKKAYNAEIKQFKQQKDDVDSYNRKLREQADLSRTLLLWELYHLEQNAKAKENEVRRIDSMLAERTEVVSSNQNNLEAARAEFANAVKNCQKVERAMRKKEKEIEECNMSLVPLKKKQKLTKSNFDAYSRRLHQIESEKETQLKEIASLERNLRVTEKAMEEFEKKIEEKKRSQLNISDSDLREYDLLLAQFNNQTSAQQSQIQHVLRRKRTAEDSVNSLQQRKDQLNKQAESIKSALDTITNKHAQLSEMTTVENDKLVSLKRHLESVVNQGIERSNKDRELNEKLQQVLLQLAEYNADLRETEQEKRNQEIMKKLKHSIPGVKGFVHQLCAPKQRRYASAVATVLGRNTNAIVVDTFQTGTQCLEFLKANKMSVMTFIPLDTISVRPVERSLRNVLPEARLAIDCVEYDPSAETAIQYVCADTMICDELEVAKSLRWKHNINVKAVTLDGSVINKANLMTGGFSGDRAAAKWEDSKVRGLKLMKDQLMDELQVLSSKAHEFEDSEDKARSEISSCEIRLKSLRDKLSEYTVSQKSRQDELSFVTRQLEELEPQLQGSLESLQELENEHDAIEDSLTNARTSVFGSFCSRLGIEDIRTFGDNQSKFAAEASRKRLEFTTNSSRIKKQIEHFQSLLQETERRKSVIDANIKREETSSEQFKSDLNALSEKVAELEQEKQNLENKLKERIETRDKLKLEEQKQHESLKDSVTAQREAETDLSNAQGEVDSLYSGRLNILRTCKLEMTEIPLLEGSLDNIPLNAVEAPSGTGQDSDGDVAMGEEGSSNDKGYGIVINYGDLNDELRENSDESVKEELENKIRTLREETELMVINSRAPEKLAKSTDHFNDASREFDDLKKQAKEARDKFNAIKRKRYDRFEAAFSKVSEEIQTIYRELTKSQAAPLGGTAQLSLENEDEPYLGGIRYHAMPPMKRFCDIELLSGGEKTMAALALLFAIHAYQKAPFFVLDEVDAALDNANIASIARYINSNCGDDLQFIVISLKNGLFEKSESLVGIYRNQDENSSRALTLDLGKYAR